MLTHEQLTVKSKHKMMHASAADLLLTEHVRAVCICHLSCFLVFLPCRQVFYNADDDQSYFDYQNDGLEDTMSSYLHEMSEFEYRGTWARFRCVQLCS